MKVPEPKVALENICSVIHDNVLYTYSAGAFQSLALEQGAEWKILSQGESVTGAVCVGSNPKDASQAGLYIVGGKAASADYRGLQKFTYSTGKWESITPQDPVTQDRLLHGATYLPGSDQIVMYGGSQDGYSGPSTQTFVVGASAPYNTRAFSSTAAPVINPILLPWSDTQAALVGGSATNNKIMLFSPDTAWTDSGATLADPLTKDRAAMQAVIINGDDGSKSLFTFDLSMTPNQVKRMVLIDASGAPVVNSAAVSKKVTREATGEFVKRALTLSDWPAYNSTFAPVGTRLNYSVAQDPDGLVVFAGGSGSANDSLCIFNARGNTWENAAQKLSEQDVLISSESTSSAGGTAATQTASSSDLLGPAYSTLPASISASASASSAASSETAAVGAPAAVSANAILGIVLGTITGIMILLGLSLFCIRRRRAAKNRQNAEIPNTRGMSPRGFPDEKAGLGYGADDFGSAPGGHFRGHQQQESAGSFSSMAILMGKVNGNNTQKSGGLRDDSNSLFKSTIGKPIPQTNDEPALSPPSRDEKGVSFAADVAEPRPATRGAPVGRNGETRRSSGWNRYWSGGSALNILGFGNSKRTTVDSDNSSRYSNGVDRNRITQDSATVPPLHLITQDLSTIPPIQHNGRPELSRVASGSPTVSNYSNQIPFRDGVSATIESPRRPQSDMSSGYSSGIPESVRDTWDPTGSSRPWGADRAASSVYAESLYPTSLAPSMPNRQIQTDNQVGVSQQPPLPMASTSDMSWLNLGEINKQNQR
ncbi:pre-mRNA splicing factor CLF1 [Colletotrichum navitas]|uniref:Pre-mRNA splicing factor CLF1 n=1 Tax=Colletotrichum navitas TaxID=681940 RepID=A0AAD8QD39_9PEZI|nr:pre-mRNA splicing factor CLF1 [Colletotrichum navitas]KAK1600145.1 pre-mRNA splicing factor CLF1 [Colletotrichum navitas]